ncbi:hypothetical protein AKJ09_08705 [Labilithrix luteola]|uniref:Uncharacterized protein n=1 Tax=Labilithrix luteola TaxID=1391654 RepID=A0A0K1Q8P4_9BACT|nr:hypothetical protein [Labilithrix luteola]AKV02042.1 hypothetical protein AKJ09_08705 [Labilithrix luteola]
MNGLDDDALALLRATEDVGVPDAEALDRVRRSLVAKVAVSGASALGAMAATKTASAAPAAMGAGGATTAMAVTAAKGLAALLLVGAAAGGTYEYVAAREAVNPPSPLPASPRALESATPITAAPGPAPNGSTANAAPGPPSDAIAVDVRSLKSPVVEVVAPRAEPTVVRDEKPHAPAESPEERAPKPPSLRDDLDRLREAQRALANGSPDRALEVVAAVVDGSPLVEERDALRSIARCTVAKRDGGTSTLDAEARAFSERHPSSSFMARVLRACDSAR